MIAPWEISNGYGLFAVMTIHRPEIIVEGSNDGVTWLEYEFKYKPGDVRRRPPGFGSRRMSAPTTETISGSLT